MEKLKKYQKQIFTFVTIFLLLEFGVFPCLTMANTFANIIGGVALGILILWGVLELSDYIKSNKEQTNKAEKEWQKHIKKVQDDMKPKVTRKPKTTKTK